MSAAEIIQIYLVWLGVVAGFYALVGFLAYSSSGQLSIGLSAEGVDETLIPSDGARSWQDYAWFGAKAVGFLTGSLLVFAFVGTRWLGWVIPVLFSLANGCLLAVTLNPEGRRGWKLAGLSWGIASFVLAAFVPNWFTNGLITAGASLALLLTAKRIPVRTAAAISAFLFAYDVFHVFGSGLMERAALAAEATPALITVPSALRWQAAPLFAIGAGDITVPGLVALVGFRLASANRKPGIAVATVAGILAGHIVAVIAVILMRRGQPALLYLLPCAWIGFGLAAGRRWKDLEDPIGSESVEPLSTQSDTAPTKE